MLYTLMHKKIAVAQLEIDDVTSSILRIVDVGDIAHLPVGCGVKHGIPDRQSLDAWWRGRAIPASRSGLRQALEDMNLSHSEQLLTKCYGLSLSDQYWVSPQEHPLDWDAANFFDNPFSEDVGNVLFERAIPGEELDLISPDNTSDGWLRKKWKIINGKRCLIKGGSNPYQQEPLNEALATAIHRRLGYATYAPYSVTWEGGLPYSVCENFVSKDTELVTAHSILSTQRRPNHRSPYEHFLDCCAELGIPGMRDFMDYLLATDYLIANTDRHWGNFGVLRDANTLKWLGPAPIFDSGTSLYHDKLTQSILPAADVPSKPLKKKHSEQIALVGSFDGVDFAALDGIADELHAIYDASPFMDDGRIPALGAALTRRMNQLQKIAQTHTPAQGIKLQM